MRTIGDTARAAGGWMRAATAGLTLAGALLTTACEVDTTGLDNSFRQRRVDVGGYTLRMREYAGRGPSVVFVAGLGEPVLTWRGVPAQVAEFAKVVTYDRAGVGASDASPGPRSSRDVATELRTMLRTAGIAAPYVLVGHSLGAMHMQMFAELYPGETAGLVFLDPTPAAQVLALAGAVPPGLTLEQVLTMIADEQGLTGGARGEFLAQVTSAEQVAAAGALPDVPVHVLTSMRVEQGGSAEERQAWFALHATLGAGVRDFVHAGVADAGHHIHWDRPALVVEAIRAIAQKAR